MLKRIVLAAVSVILAWIAWEWITFPDVAALAERPPETTAFMERRKAELRSEGRSDELRWKWVPYSRISPHLRRGVLVAEDNSFYEHEGVDVKGMREALTRNLKRRRITHGGSTITQQLAKNLYLSPSRNPLRKLREYFLARALEKHLPKKRILELYLNVVEMGERIYGAEAAARFYFDRSAASLTPRQAALLAGCLPNPRTMNPADPNKRLRARQNMILSRMRRWGHLVETEVLTEAKTPKPEPAAPGDDSATVDESAPTSAVTESSATAEERTEPSTADTISAPLPPSTAEEPPALPEIAPPPTETNPTTGETSPPVPTNP